jgi:hypothetical protein
MFLILGLGIAIIGLIIVKYFEVIEDVMASTVLVVTSIVLFVILIVLPCTRYEIRSEIVAFKQVDQCIKTARTSIDLSPLERASLTSTIIESNVWLAQKQFINAGFWDIFIPDEVDTMKKLK